MWMPRDSRLSCNMRYCDYMFLYTLAQAKNSEMLVECFYALEDFVALGRLMDALPDGSPLLTNIGEKFQSVGLCNEGVTAFLKAGDTKRAIDCCVLLNQWDQAVALAQVGARKGLKGRPEGHVHGGAAGRG
jgi:hypothetical protein